MRNLLRRLAIAGVLFHAAAAAGQAQMILVAKSGTKCLAAQGNRVVGAACSGEPSQTLTPNYAVGGLQIGVNCLRRATMVLTLAPCKAGDAAQVFEVSPASNEISSSAGPRVCIDLSGAPGIWRVNQTVALAPCNGTLSERWVVGTIAASAPPGGSARPNDAQGEVRSGNYVDLHNGRYLVIK